MEQHILDELMNMDDEEIPHIINIELSDIDELNSLQSIFNQLGGFPSTLELDLDERILQDHTIDLYSYITPEIDVKFNIPSITKLIKRSGVIDEDGIPKGIANNAAEFLSNIAYTQLKEVMNQSLIVLNERGAKVLTEQDVIRALDILGDKIIYPHIKKEK
jgi:histone H3/H4